MLGTIETLGVTDLEAVHQIASLSFPKPWKLEEFKFFLEHPYRYAIGFFTPDRVLRSYFIAILVQGDLDIISVATHPLYRRQSLGEQLMKRAKEDPEICKLFLEVETENLGAVSLYKKCGFKEQGVRKKYYEGKRDALVMSL